MASTLFKNIHKLYLASDTLKHAQKGSEMRNAHLMENAWLLCENGLISDYGPMEGAPERGDIIVDATGRLVLPAFCDSHTHLVFAAGREEEFAMRIAGKSYEEIAAAGGGILNSARRLREMEEAELFDLALIRLHSLKEMGTGAVEIKSGYGLETEAEMKMLRVIRKLGETGILSVRSTFLGAHAIPTEFQSNRAGYIQLLIEEMLPRIAGEGLADYCDVFCEQGYFSNEETGRILEAAAKYGLKPKIHVNQFSNTGGVQTGIQHNALTVDHLEVMGNEEIEALKVGNTLPVALPGCSFFLRIPYTPGREIIDAGLPLVVASDFNPGSAPSANMMFMLTLACNYMRLSPEEALTAATINGAAAMELETSHGSISRGKKASLILTKPLQGLSALPYYFAQDLIEKVYI